MLLVPELRAFSLQSNGLLFMGSLLNNSSTDVLLVVPPFGLTSDMGFPKGSGLGFSLRDGRRVVVPSFSPEAFLPPSGKSLGEKRGLSSGIRWGLRITFWLLCLISYSRVTLRFFVRLLLIISVICNVSSYVLKLVSCG